MSSTKRVSLLATLALAALALTAASASANIVDPSTGNTYSGSVAGVNTGPDPTLETSTTTITCQSADTSGSINGSALTGSLNFGWDQCSIVGGATGCTVNDINGVSVAIDESPAAPDAIIKNTSTGQTFISCALVFNCTATSTATVNQVTAEVAGGADPIASIDDQVSVSGAGCPSTGQWVAQYEITVPADGLESDN